MDRRSGLIVNCGFFLHYSEVTVLVLMLMSGSPTPARGPRLGGGAVDYQTFQRGADGTARIRLWGTCPKPGGVVQARLVRQATGQAIGGFDWQRIAAGAEGGKWSGSLLHVPTGGEYRLQLRRVDEAGKTLGVAPDVQHLLVGDLWIAAGQSNMIGRGRLGSDRETPIDQVHVFDCDYRWRRGSEPICGRNTDPLRYGPNYLHDQGQHSLCLRFAKDVYRATRVPIAILPCAIGGTSMEQWARPKQPDDPTTLYGRTIRRAAAAGGRVAGIIWWQGESNPAASVEAFARPFARLIADFRKDLGDPKLPFLFAQLANTDAQAITDDQWMNVREAQRLTAITVPHTAAIATLDQPRYDPFHVDTPGLKVIGARFALAARALVYRQKIPWSGPRFQDARFAGPSRRKVFVRFHGAHGALRPSHGIEGFQVVAGDHPIPIESAIVAPGHGDTVVLTLARPAPVGAKVRYGFGKNPQVNLLDAAGLPALSFANQPIAPGEKES